MNISVEERFEAGIELFGTEVKSIRHGNLNLKDAWCSVKDGELCGHGRCISAPMKRATSSIRTLSRPRRLLMHKREIQRLSAKVKLRTAMPSCPSRVYLEKLPRQGGGRACARAKSSMTSVPDAAR